MVLVFKKDIIKRLTKVISSETDIKIRFCLYHWPWRTFENVVGNKYGCFELYVPQAKPFPTGSSRILNESLPRKCFEKVKHAW